MQYLNGDDENETEKDRDDTGYKILADMQTANKENEIDELEKRLENILRTMVGVRRCKSFNYIYTVK
jgi:hypothetical protein